MRFFEPVEVATDLVIWLALASIAVNGVSVLMIKSDAEHSMNMKSAYIHLFGDMITSIAVLAGGILMKYFQIYWIDPMFSIMIAVYLVYMSWDIFRSSLKIMMQFTPDDVDVKVIVKEVNSIEGVRNIHHIHIWQINEHEIMLEAHISFNNDIRISEFEDIHKQARAILSNHHINHITLQPEFTSDCDKGIIGRGDC